MKVRSWFTQVTNVLTIGFALAVTSVAVAEDLIFEGDQTRTLNLKAKQSEDQKQLEAILATNPNWESLENINKSDELRKLSDAVGQLRMHHPEARRTLTCTGSLIDVDLILTNAHCVPGKVDKYGPVGSVTFLPGYYDAKGEEANFYTVETTPVVFNAELDYAVLAVRGSPGATWGTVRGTASTPVAGNSLLMVHHPGGLPKRVTRQNCAIEQTTDKDLSDQDFTHTCDTFGGSSGAPMFTGLSARMIGLHYAGTENVAETPFNYAKRLDAVVNDMIRSGSIRSEVIERLGGDPNAVVKQSSDVTHALTIKPIPKVPLMITGVELTLVIDGSNRGILSNLTSEDGIEVADLSAGSHTYELRNATFYFVDQNGATSNPRKLPDACRGTFAVDGEAILIANLSAMPGTLTPVCNLIDVNNLTKTCQWTAGPKAGLIHYLGEVPNYFGGVIGDPCMDGKGSQGVFVPDDPDAERPEFSYTCRWTQGPQAGETVYFADIPQPGEVGETCFDQKGNTGFVVEDDPDATPIYTR